MKVNGTTTLTKVRDMHLGFVVQGITYFAIDPISGNAHTAYFIFVGNPNSPVDVSFSSSNLTDGANNISFTGTLAGGSSTTEGDATLISNGTPITTNSDGEYYFWAGGSATLSPTQPFGTYSGSFTLSIAY